MLNIRIGLSDVFSLNLEAFETPVERSREQIRNSKAGFGLQDQAIQRLIRDLKPANSAPEATV